MDRRQFLKSSLLLGGAMCLDLRTFAGLLKDHGEPNVVIGVLSDIHITTAESAETFRHALEYFRDNGAHGVIIAGDMADRGMDYELQEVANAWYSVFPKDKGKDGKRVEKLFIYGNHDMEAYRWGAQTEEKLAHAIGNNRYKEVWKKCFHEKFEPVYMKTVNGYHFIGAHWSGPDNVPGLEELLRANSPKLTDTGKPFFYFQHPHPKNTCNGPYAWGQDDGTVTALLSQYPACIAFSGHSHDPLGDDRDLWQGAFTSVGTSSLRYQCLIGARENSYTDGESDPFPTQMPSMGASDGRQGMLMRIYDDCVTLERREFVFDEPLGEHWVIPVRPAERDVLTDGQRASKAAVPQFAANDKVTVSPLTAGKDRYGHEQEQMAVHFPSVLKKTHGVRAFDYEVCTEYNYLDLTAQTGVMKHVFSPHCYLGEEHDQEEVTCLYGRSELPPFGKMRFSVRPCNCFGGKGKAICSDWMDVPRHDKH